MGVLVRDSGHTVRLCNPPLNRPRSSTICFTMGFEYRDGNLVPIFWDGADAMLMIVMVTLVQIWVQCGSGCSAVFLESADDLQREFEFFPVHKRSRNTYGAALRLTLPADQLASLICSLVLPAANFLADMSRKQTAIRMIMTRTRGVTIQKSSSDAKPSRPTHARGVIWSPMLIPKVTRTLILPRSFCTSDGNRTSYTSPTCVQRSESCYRPNEAHGKLRSGRIPDTLNIWVLN